MLLKSNLVPQSVAPRAKFAPETVLLYKENVKERSGLCRGVAVASPPVRGKRILQKIKESIATLFYYK